jgi:hypothetical protein
MYIYRRRFPAHLVQRSQLLSPRYSQLVPTLGQFAALYEPPNINDLQFSRTLDRIAMPADVAAFLQSSQKFRDMVDALNKRYVSIWNQAGAGATHIVRPISDDGVITTGSFKGRRVIDVEQSSNGSMFEPHSPKLTGEYDKIWIQRPDSSDTLRWIEIVAHETGHAFNLINRTGTPAKMADRIRAAVVDEIEARKTEATVIAQIMQTTAGQQQLGGQTSQTGSTDPATVERNLFPGVPRKTYLESFVLSELLREAIVKENLGSSDIDKHRMAVENIPIKGWRDRQFKTNFAKFLFWQRVIDFRWKRFDELQRKGQKINREQVLQEHANAFFGGIIAYTHLPKPPAPKPVAQPPRKVPMRPVP